MTAEDSSQTSVSGQTIQSEEVSARILSEYRALVQGCDRMSYAVKGVNTWPEIAHSPFVALETKAGEGYFVLGSTLSRGSRSLLDAAQEDAPCTAVLFVAEAKEVKEPFAATRAQVVVRVEDVPRDDPLWRTVVDKMTERYGETARLLESLADFHVFGLFPHECLFIKGFGKAFSLSGENLQRVVHLNRS